MGRKRSRQGKYIHLFITGAVLIGLGISGCSGVQGLLARPDYWQADQYLAEGNYTAALAQYRQIPPLYPQARMRPSFGIGCILANPQNPERNYEKSLDTLKQLVTEFPRSKYRASAETLICPHRRGDEPRQGGAGLQEAGRIRTKSRSRACRKQIESLQKQIEQMKEIDRSLEEKRRAMPPRK